MAANALSSTASIEPAARLFEQYGAQLLRYCLARLRSREEAEDAVQSTFLRVHKALEQGVVPEYEAAWLYKIAHNVCVTRRSVLGRRAEQPIDDLPLAAPEGRGDELIGLSDALADLSPRLREALLLREWQGLSYSEIAVAMGTTVPAVETLLFRGRRELAAALEGEPTRRPRIVVVIAALLGRALELAPAKLAGGAALLAIGGAGIGAAVTVTAPHHASHAGRQPDGIVGAAIDVPQRHAVRHTLAVGPAAPKPAHRVAVVPVAHPAASPISDVTRVGPPAPIEPEPAASTVPAAARSQPAPTAAPAPAPSAQPAPEPQQAPAPATTAVPAIQTPPVSLPPVSLAPGTVATPVVTETVTTPALPPLDLGH